MKDPLKPRDKITQKMTRDGAIAENQTTGDTERISKRTQDADFQKSPEQQAAQDAAQLQGAASPTSPLPHVPGAAPKADTGKTERVMEHIEAAHTRKASKKAVRKAQAEATAGTKSSRLQFTDCNLPTRNALPRSLKSISRNPIKPPTDWIRQRQLSPKKRNLRKSAPLTKPPGKARPACTLRKRTSRPDLRRSTTRYPAPHRKPGFWYITKSILSKRIIPAWRAHTRARKPQNGD